MFADCFGADVVASPALNSNKRKNLEIAIPEDT